MYGRRESTSGPVLVPHIKEVITIPQETPVPLGTKNKRRGARGRSKSKANSPPLPASNPEEGWDDDTVPHAHVVDFVTGEEVDRRECPITVIQCFMCSIESSFRHSVYA